MASVNDEHDNASQWFSNIDGLDLNDAQREYVAGLRRCIVEKRPRLLDPGHTGAEMLAENKLQIEVAHRMDGDASVTISIDRYGWVGILCAGQHPEFELCFNDTWEPYDCAGDLALGIEVTCALLDGRIESELVWSGEHLAFSKDVLVRMDGSRVPLAKRYHSALLGAIFRRRHEIRAVSFA